jgi:hypothetical protein
MELSYYAKQGGIVNIEILDSANKNVIEAFIDTAEVGLNIFKYDYRVYSNSPMKAISENFLNGEDGKRYISKGHYNIRISQSKARDEKQVDFTEK